MWRPHLRHVKLRRSTKILLALVILVALFVGLPKNHLPDYGSLSSTLHHVASPGAEVTLVVARRKAENSAWLASQRPEWEKVFYTVDDPNAKLTVPKNKGREAMVYLTYIIDHYDDLKPVTIFVHAERYQWHNDDPDYDGQRVLQRLNVSHVKAQGYTNLRCTWTLGCPAEIRPWFAELEPDEPTVSSNIPPTAGKVYKPSFEQLFPSAQVPGVVASPCCAQFAVANETIRARPKSDYERYRSWLLETELEDALSGRVLEYSWHIIFGKPPVFCPTARECYENLYGIHGLECYEEGTCVGRYDLPPAATLPKGWPEQGWDGEQRTLSDG
ncbi:hypothetical protein MBLNU459_g5181t2 [Dothideomycetes sp. NU459]